MTLPYQWQPKIVSTQVAIIGNIVIAGVPAEFTTMSGRRLRNVIEKVVNDASDDETFVIVAGLCNTYSDYVTTPEEYQVKFELLLLKPLLENRETTSEILHVKRVEICYDDFFYNIRKIFNFAQLPFGRDK